MRPRVTRQTKFATIVLLLLVAFLELASYLAAQLTDDTFSHENRLIARIAAERRTYEQFLATRYDAAAGWRNPASERVVGPNCSHGTNTIFFDSIGARRAGMIDAPQADADVIVFGDSYALGYEVDYDGSFPAQLSALLGQPVANHGVGGFGPLQATLTFERLADAYPQARIAVLAVMYENIRRVPNSFRPVYRPRTGMLFAFKPYVDISGGAPSFVDNPNGPAPRDFDAMLALARERFRADYWAKPLLQLPYTVSLYRGATSAYAYKTLVGRRLGAFGVPQFALDYADDTMLNGLRSVIDRFIDGARVRGLKSAIMFIPFDSNDLTSPDSLVQEYTDRKLDDVVVANVGHADLDWANYVTVKDCHPSPAGYGGIAAATFAALRARGWIELPARAPGGDGP